MTRTRSLRGQIWGTALVVVVAAGSSLAVTSQPALAATQTSNQSVTATIAAGALAITAPATLVITSTAPGTNTGAETLGTLIAQDTLNDSTNLTVVVNPTDLATGGGPCPTARTGVATIWTGWNFNTGSTVFANDAGCPGTAGTLTKGAGGSPTLGGSDTPLGCAYGTSAVTLATATDTGNVNEGAWDMTGTTVNLNISGQASAGAYSATLQYTITG
jgi:hypothetical protein